MLLERPCVLPVLSIETTWEGRIPSLKLRGYLPISHFSLLVLLSIHLSHYPIPYRQLPPLSQLGTRVLGGGGDWGLRKFEFLFQAY